MIFEGVKKVFPGTTKPKYGHPSGLMKAYAERIQEMTGIPAKEAFDVLKAMHNITCQDWITDNVLYHPVLGAVYIREKRRMGKWNGELRAVEKDVEYVHQSLRTTHTIPGSFNRAQNLCNKYQFDKNKYAKKKKGK